MVGLPSRLRLDTRRDIERRIPFILRYLGREYTVKLVGYRRLDPLRLYSTESALESDKLGLVLRAVLYEGYDAPIIAILGYGGRLYIYDGHHRSRVYLWLERLVDAYLIEARGYRPRISIPLAKTPVINPPQRPSGEVSVWMHMVNVIFFLERRHNILARVWRERIPVERLHATQPLAKPVTKPYDKATPPILAYWFDGEYYVVDGHTRVCSALLSGRTHVDAIVFTLHKKIGLIRTSEALGKPRFSKEYCHAPNTISCGGGASVWD